MIVKKKAGRFLLGIALTVALLTGCAGGQPASSLETELPDSIGAALQKGMDGEAGAEAGKGLLEGSVEETSEGSTEETSEGSAEETSEGSTEEMPEKAVEKTEKGTVKESAERNPKEASGSGEWGTAGNEMTGAGKGNDLSQKNLTAQDVVGQMKIGWNLGNTLDSHGSYLNRAMAPEQWETAWGNPVTTRELIQAVVSEGFNVIRIPVTWEGHLSQEDNWKIDEDWMDRVQEVVDYAYDAGAYVIINAHHESWYYPYYENQEKASQMLQAVWSQIAERFRDYDEHLIFEGMNEPRKIGTALEWNGGDQEGWDVVNACNEVFVETIRSSGGNNPYRILMIPGYAANCWEAVKHIEVPEDDKIIVSVHAYEPYDFALNVNGRGIWNQDTGNIDYIMKSLDELFVSRGIPVIIGEFGAMYKPAEGNEAERAAWAEYYVRAAAGKGIPCIWWDNGAFEGSGELFGLIDRETCEWKYPLVLQGLKKGLTE